MLGFGSVVMDNLWMMDVTSAASRSSFSQQPTIEAFGRLAAMRRSSSSISSRSSASIVGGTSYSKLMHSRPVDEREPPTTTGNYLHHHCTDGKRTTTETIALLESRLNFTMASRLPDWRHRTAPGATRNQADSHHTASTISLLFGDFSHSATVHSTHN